VLHLPRQSRPFQVSAVACPVGAFFGQLGFRKMTEFELVRSVEVVEGGCTLVKLDALFDGRREDQPQHSRIFSRWTTAKHAATGEQMRPAEGCKLERSVLTSEGVPFRGPRRLHFR
jgi:hypothetical protein